MDDNDPEPDEPFTVEIRIPGEPTITTTVTIIDDDGMSVCKYMCTLAVVTKCTPNRTCLPVTDFWMVYYE